MIEKYFSALSILPTLVWLIIIVVTGYAIRNANSDKPHYRYYMPNLFAKLFFSLAFALVYLLYYQGGDTVAYYDGAITLNNLFLKSPSLYFEQMFNVKNQYRYDVFYDASTGFPPGWIYREHQGFFVCKLMSLISAVTLKSYLAMTFIMAFITTHATWKLFDLIRTYNLCNEKMLALGLLLLPSVNFWCAGVSKDTVVYIASIYLIYNGFKIISDKHKSTIFNFIVLIIVSFIIYRVRAFILVAILIPFLFSMMTRLVRAFGGGSMVLVIIRAVVLLVGLAYAGVSVINQSESEFLESNSFLAEAQTIQDDFSKNELYGTKKYNLGKIEYTPLGLIKIMPLAIVTGIFRPFIWEARSVALVMNGFESIFFIYLTFSFFRANWRKKWNMIKSHEFLIFCLIFIFIVAFMTGFTSMLYGVLVRLRAPLLPFLLILLSLNIEMNSKEEMEEKVIIEN